MTDGVVLAQSPRMKFPVELTMAGNLLFVPSATRITVLNIHTLEKIKTFGNFGTVSDCAVRNDELYVADFHAPGQLEVFSFGGQKRGTVYGGFGRPMSLCIRDDRIYLIEDEDDEPEEYQLSLSEDAVKEPEPGKRLVVLGIDGDDEDLLQHQVIRLNGDTKPEKSVRFCGDDLLISDQDMRSVHVLRFFGSN